MPTPDSNRPEGRSGHAGSRWGRRAITLVLLAIAVAAGIAVYGSRQQWWEMYLKYLGK